MSFEYDERRKKKKKTETLYKHFYNQTMIVCSGESSAVFAEMIPDECPEAPKRKKRAQFKRRRPSESTKRTKEGNFALGNKMPERGEHNGLVVWVFRFV